MLNRDSRVSTGTAGQVELKALLEINFGFTCIDTGQESWLPAALHERLRDNHTDLMVRAVRYQPDLLAWSPRFRLAYWDAKVNTVPGTPNFTLELACYQEQLARCQKGERVAFAFRDTDSRWFAQWAHRLRVTDASFAWRDKRHQAQGSHTPFVLIAKSSCESLMAFVALGDR